MPESPAETKLSATILLLRDRGELQVLMVKRHYQIDFASGALVFPGGKTDKDDSNPGWDELTDGDFGPVQQDARIAAVREAFEESGILLARPRSARGLRAPLVGRETADSLAPYRGAVDRREARFIDLIARNGLVLALDSLIHFGHWITPVMMPKRFDTHFYLAPAPADQIAASDGRETTDAIWLNAAGALDREARGEASIIFPTRMNLRKLSEAETVEDAISRFSNASVVTVEPRAGKNAEGQPCLFIPEEAGYGVTEELLSNVRV